MNIRVDDNIAAVRRQLTRLERKQIPFAAAKALTMTASDAKRAIDRQLPMKLDRPTRFTMNAIAIRRATKSNQQSEVYVRPLQAQYLRYQIEGGVRKARGGGIGVPTRNARLNKFGNIPGRRSGLIKNKRQFIATINGVAGVWERTGGRRGVGVKLIAAFEQQVKYSKRLPFYKIAGSTARSTFGKNFVKTMNQALATAR